MTGYRIVYITGFMGSGKTTAGKKLASELNFAFIDLDEEIEKKEGKSVREVFAEEGEDYFRRTESETLRNLRFSSDTVVATGGGTVCFRENLSFMKDSGVLIYLRMTPLQLYERLSAAPGDRPLLKNLTGAELLEYISGKLNDREEFYLKATYIADGMNLDIRTLGNTILAFFR